MPRAQTGPCCSRRTERKFLTELLDQDAEPGRGVLLAWKLKRATRAH